MRAWLPAAAAISWMTSALGIAGPRLARGGHFEGDGEEGVTGEDGDGFAEDFVRGGLAAAEIVVVHAGEIVMDEGVGVDALDGAGEGEGLGGFAADDLGAGEADDGAEALAAGEDGVAHRLVDGGGLGGGGREVVIERGVDFFLAGRPIG